jgi:hypothetical protein
MTLMKPSSVNLMPRISNWTNFKNKLLLEPRDLLNWRLPISKPLM